jgi:hypothetical protein
VSSVDHEPDEVGRPALDLDQQDPNWLLVEVDGPQYRLGLVVALGDGVRRRANQMALVLGHTQVADRADVLTR